MINAAIKGIATHNIPAMMILTPSIPKAFGLMLVELRVPNFPVNIA